VQGAASNKVREEGEVEDAGAEAGWGGGGLNGGVRRMKRENGYS